MIRLLTYGSRKSWIITTHRYKNTTDDRLICSADTRRSTDYFDDTPHLYAYHLRVSKISSAKQDIVFFCRRVSVCGKPKKRGIIFRNWCDLRLNFGDIFPRSLTLRTIFDNKIACNMKTTGQIMKQFDTVRSTEVKGFFPFNGSSFYKCSK